MTNTSISLSAVRPEDLPSLTAGMYLSGSSSQDDPFLVQLVEVLEAGPTMLKATLRPVQVEDVYQSFQLDATGTFGLEASRPGVSLLENTAQRFTGIKLADGAKLEFLPGVSVQATGGLKPTFHCKVDLFPSFVVDCAFSLDISGTLTFSFAAAASLAVEHEKELPIKPRVKILLLDSSYGTLRCFNIHKQMIFPSTVFTNTHVSYHISF